MTSLQKANFNESRHKMPTINNHLFTASSFMKIKFFMMVLFAINSIQLYGREICKPIRNYSIDVVQSIMDDSLRWQKEEKDFLNNNEESPLRIEKVFIIPDSEELVISFNKNQFQKGYFPDYQKTLFIHYASQQFSIKDHAQSHYKKLNQLLHERFRKFLITFTPFEKYGKIVIYNTETKTKYHYTPNLYLLSARFVFLCKLNIEDPFISLNIPSPIFLDISAYQVGSVIFIWEDNYYKLNIYKGKKDSNKLFTYYYEPQSSVGKFMEIKKRRGNFYILDFNKSYYHYCSLNGALECPKKSGINNLSISFPAGEKLNEPK